jgi:hypothetical protein
MTLGKPLGARTRLLITLLAIAGVLFSGYLSYEGMVKGTCTGCQFLFGYPTCLYGFVMFALILLGALLSGKHASGAALVRVVTAAGILFSVYWAIVELRVCWFCYPLGLPNCVYGLVMYCVVAALAFPRTDLR